MQLLADSWKIVVEQRSIVAVYTAMVAIIALSQRVFNQAAEYVLGVEPGVVMNIVLIAEKVVLSAGYAAVYAVIFARLGKEIDKPLWKCKDDAEALRRFFMPWFILVLIFMMLVRVQMVIVQQDLGDAGLMVEFLIMLTFVFIIPLGACVMYWGRLDFDELPEALSPISRQLPLVALALLLGFAEFFVGYYIYPSLLPELLAKKPLVHIPIDIALGVVDCWIFATMWLVLIVHRDADYDHDIDF